MSRDDCVNVAVLVVILIFLALVVPAQMRMDDDAAYGLAVKNSWHQLVK